MTVSSELSDQICPSSFATFHGCSLQYDKVLVAGAGPVGLLIALRLGQAGIQVDVFEKEESLSDHPRAAGYFAAALLALKKANVLASVRQHGFTTHGLCWRKPVADDGNGGKRLGDIIASLTFPKAEGIDNGVIYPQCDLVKLLYSHAMNTGSVTVHFGHELRVIQEEEDGIVATTRLPNGEEKCFHGAFLVGADGGKSATRKLMGIPFKGHTWPERLVAVDLFTEINDLDHRIPTSMIVDPVHYGILTPLNKPEIGKKTLYRCSFAIDPEDSRSDDELSTTTAIMPLLDKMIPGPRPLEVQVKKVSPYKIHQLCASTFRRGRCVLAGDAAHLNNPFGAMGLCTGLIDADALSDALELIIKEGKPLTLLDFYSDERRKVFQTFVDPISSQNKLRCANDPEAAMEDWFLRAVSKASPADLIKLGAPFFEAWRTDMRTFVDTA